MSVCDQDEPTNYLDNDTLAALTHALKSFKVRAFCIWVFLSGKKPRRDRV